MKSESTNLFTACPIPAHLEDSIIRASEDVKEARGHVQITVVAGGTFVLDGGDRGLAVGGDFDLLATLGTRVSSAILCAVQRNDVIVVVVPVTTRSETSLVKSGSTAETPLNGGGGSEGGDGGDCDSGEEHLDVFSLLEQE